jgi:dolichol-phosphate mannosyltransferase
LLAYSILSGASLAFFPVTWREEDQVTNVRMVRQTNRMVRILGQLLLAKEAFMTEWHQPEQPYESDVVVQSPATKA